MSTHRKNKSFKQVNGGAQRFRYNVTLPTLEATGSLLAANSTHAEDIVRRAYPRNALVTVARAFLLPFAFCLLPFAL